MGGLDPGGIAVAVGGAVASVIGAWSLYTKAKIKGGAALLVLRRLWDWIEGQDLKQHVPPTLRRDVLHELEFEDDAKEGSNGSSA